MASQVKYMTDFEAKAAICEIGRRMYGKNFVAANDGNITVKVGPNAIWATPTGVSKGYMTPDMLVKMDLKGNVLAGKSKPSSEVKMHLRVYNENSEVNSVMHAHPPMATAFAIAGIDLDQAVFAESIVLLGVIPVTKYALTGTQEVPDSVAPFCKDYNAVLLANHGALTWGRDAFEAYYRLESLEHYAHIYMYASSVLKKTMPLNCSQVADLVNLREKIGIKGGGIPVCDIETNPAQQTQKNLIYDQTTGSGCGTNSLDSETSQSSDLIMTIVDKVTAEVVKGLYK